MRPPSLELRSKTIAWASVVLLGTVWLLTHGYQGLTGDAQIYALQALARTNPQFKADLYLQNTTQDQFTVFSPFYSRAISLMGLENAARFLMLVFIMWLLAATWLIARSFAPRVSPWLAVAALMVLPDDYGGSGVFHFFEQSLTARLPAEALIATAIVFHCRGFRIFALFLAAAAMFIHPLMALPGLLLLIFLSLPCRHVVLLCTAGIVCVLFLCVAATGTAIMDEPWLYVVQERSQFLFLQLWQVRDWLSNTRPFLDLGLFVLVLPDERTRKLCIAAALVGAAGLAVALIAGLIGPVALLVQGQAWRWVWIAAFVSIVLLPAAAMHMWREEKCGRLCAVLLLLSEALPAVYGISCVSLALLAWTMRVHVSAGAARRADFLAWTIALASVGWVCSEWWSVVMSTHRGDFHAAWMTLHEAPNSRIAVGLTAFLALRWISRIQSPTLLALSSAPWIFLSVLLSPLTLKQAHVYGAAADARRFADWTSAIPSTSTVLVVPPLDSGAFVWFTLGRPNYLAVNQSAGVVFSRETALEIVRRSEILLPLMDADWKIRSRLSVSTRDRRPLVPTRILTAANLRRVCSDDELGFVISPVIVDFPRVRHKGEDVLKDWNLYDCRGVRANASY